MAINAQQVESYGLQTYFGQAFLTDINFTKFSTLVSLSAAIMSLRHRGTTLLLLFMCMFSIVVSTEGRFFDTFLRYANGTDYIQSGITSIEFIHGRPSLLLVGTITGTVTLIFIEHITPTRYIIVRTLDEISVGLGRSILGITSDPFLPDTYYVSTSSFRWRQQGFPDSGWQNGKVEKLRFDPYTHTIKVVGPLVEGLPVSLSNGAVYGTAVDPFTSVLYISIGAFNNGGAESPSEGNLPDSIYSAAILEVNIRQDNLTRVLMWTSDNPATASLKQKPSESGISLLAEGLRSSFELNVFLSGDLYVFDAGANKAGSSEAPGPKSISCTESVPIDVSQPDKIIRVERGKWYGHPNRARNLCVFVSPLLSREEALKLAPGVTLPLFTSTEAIEENIVVGSPAGALEYTPAWFPSLRGTFMGIEEPPFQNRGGGLLAGTASHNLETKEIIRVANLSGISAITDSYGSMLSASLQEGKIGIAVPKVTNKIRRERAVRVVWPTRGLQGSKIRIAVSGPLSRQVTIGGYRTFCKRWVRKIRGIRILTCFVPRGEFPKEAVTVTVGPVELQDAFIAL